MANNENYTANIIINNSPARTKMKELMDDVDSLKRKRDEMLKEGSKASKKELADISRQIKAGEKEVQHYEKVVFGLSGTIGRLSKMSYKELEQTHKALIKELRSGNIEKESEEWKEYAGKIREVRQEMDKYNEATARGSGGFSKLNKWVNVSWYSIDAMLQTLSGVPGIIRKCVGDFSTMDQEMENVRKYTGQTKDEVVAMNEKFKETDTRTTREELNRLAGVAGRLGITAEKDILEFVDAADKIRVALGDDLGEGAVDTIGKLAIAFGESDRLGLRSAMLATGSALNEIVQNSSAQAQPVVEFTRALSGVGQQAHMTQAEIMGFASALDQNNQEMATSSTVMSQLITKMYQDPAKFASMAGLEAKGFAKLIKEDMNQALLEWFKASQKLGDMSVLAGAFDKLGMDGTRAVGVLSTLAGHIDQVVEAQDVANRGYQKATSVIDEFNIQNETVQASLEKAQEQFKEMSVELGEKLLPVVKYTISSSAMLARGLATAARFAMEHSTALITLTAAYAAYLAVSKADMAVMKALAMGKKAYGTVVAWLTAQNANYTKAMVLQRDAVAGCTTAHKKMAETVVASNTVTKIAIAGISLLKAAYFALTFQFGAAKAALVGFNAVMAANPVGLALTAVAAVAGGFLLWKNRTKETADEIEKLAKKQNILQEVMKQGNVSVAKEKARFEELNKTLRDSNASLDDRKKALTAIKQIVPDYHGALSKEGKLINDNKDALDRYIRRLQAVAIAQAAFDKLTELQKQKLDAEMKRKQGQAAADSVNSESAWEVGAKNEKDPHYAQGQKIKLGIANKEIADADAVLAKVNAEIKAVNDFINSSKEYKAAFNSITTEGNGTVGTVSPGTYKTDKELKKEQTEWEKRLKGEADAAKAEYQAQLAEEMLAYRKGKVSYSDYLERKHRLVQEYYDKVKAIYGEDSNEYKSVLDNREKEESEYYQSLTKKKEDALSAEKLERDHRIRMQFLDKANAGTYQNEERLKENLFRSEMEYMVRKRDLYHRGSKEWTEWEQKIQNAGKEHQYELEENYQKKLLQYRKEFALMSVGELEEIELDGVRKMYEALRKEGRMTEEEYRRIVQAIRQSFAAMEADSAADSRMDAKASKALDTARKKAGAQDVGGGNDLVTAVGGFLTAVEQQQTVNEKLRELYKEGAIDYATYEEAKRQNARETAEVMLSAASVALGQIGQMLGDVSAYARACSDLETAEITKNYDAQIAAAGNNSKKKEKLEAERDEKIRQAKSKANKKAMAIELAQAVASTALAAINAYSSAAKIPVTGWVLAPIAAGLATASGLLQIATIKKQHQAEAMGYYSGGFTGGRNYRREAGVVHEGEFVANHQAVDNPRLAPVFDLLDKAQKNNMVGALTARDVTNVMGGPASAAVVPIVNVQTDMAEIRENLDAVTEVVSMLNDTLQEPIEARMSMQQFDKDYKRYRNLLNSK